MLFGKAQQSVRKRKHNPEQRSDLQINQEFLHSSPLAHSPLSTNSDGY